SGWGEVIAVEAQERVFYALAGNIAINNCFNARAMNAAVAARSGTMKIPRPDYLTPASFGSLELRQRDRGELLSQTVDYSEQNAVTIPTVAIASLTLPRIDLIKIDVEGMEVEAIEGAAASLARCRPILIVEAIKSDQAKLSEILLGQGYRLFGMGL